MSGDAPLRKLKLIVEYVGTAYAGWQLQKDADSVQARLTAAVERMTGERATLTAAGRTDAGVHATGQVVSFATTSSIEARRFAPGLNSYLPDDISVHSAEEVRPRFDARRDSLSKRYRYRIYVAAQPAAIELDRAWQMRGPLDVAAMRAAAAQLVGEHDFNAFRSVHCDAPHARRAMYGVDIAVTPRPPAGEHVDIYLHANAFLRHMCRIIAGTLVEVGRGKRPVESISELLESGERTRAGVTAPPGGLTLLEVVYPESDD